MEDEESFNKVIVKWMCDVMMFFGCGTCSNKAVFYDCHYRQHLKFQENCHSGCHAYFKLQLVLSVRFTVSVWAAI